jgi:hypothetical protein
MKRTSYFEAALAVLEAEGRPMTVREIVKEALARGLLRPRGRTPEATMSARLYTYVRDTPNGLLVRHAELGKTRARRGTVTWSLRTPAGRTPLI